MAEHSNGDALADAGMSEELRRQMQAVNFSLGRAGGIALVKSILLNAGLAPVRALELAARVTGPPITSEAAGFEIKCGERTFFAESAEVDADHDFGAELNKLKKLSVQDLKTAKDYLSLIFYMIRKAYSMSLVIPANAVLLREAAPLLDGFNPEALHLDSDNTTLFLKIGDVECLPRAGLRLREL